MRYTGRQLVEIGPVATYLGGDAASAGKHGGLSLNVAKILGAALPEDLPQRLPQPGDT